MRSKKDINVQIGQQIRSARERAGLTQEQLSEKLDCSPQFVSDMERGVVGISIAMLRRLCVMLGISSDSILFGSEGENNVSAVTERCRGLSEEKFKLLLNIIDSYLQAID